MTLEQQIEQTIFKYRMQEIEKGISLEEAYSKQHIVYSVLRWYQHAFIAISDDNPRWMKYFMSNCPLQSLKTVQTIYRDNDKKTALSLLFDLHERTIDHLETLGFQKGTYQDIFQTEVRHSEVIEECNQAAMQCYVLIDQIDQTLEKTAKFLATFKK